MNGTGRFPAKEGPVWLRTHDKPIRVYFLGSDAVATPVLHRVLEAGPIHVVGIGSQPDRPAGRRRRLRPTAVAEFAESAGWSVDKPESVNAPDFVAHIRDLRPDVIVVMAFGQILKPVLLDLPPFGCLNVHLSLLPRHRGAAPVAAAILAGDEKTGVSFMKMDEGLDTGPVYMQVPVPIRPDDTTETLEARLAETAAEHIVPCLERVVRDGLEPVPQDAGQVTLARKIRKNDAYLDFRRLPGTVLERMVRAYIPWPRAWFVADVNGRPRRIQVLRAALTDGFPDLHPGEVLPAGDSLRIQCADGTALDIQELIPEGQHAMGADAFLRGCRTPLRVISDRAAGPDSVRGT